MIIIVVIVVVVVVIVIIVIVMVLLVVEFNKIQLNFELKLNSCSAYPVLSDFLGAFKRKITPPVHVIRFLY